MGLVGRTVIVAAVTAACDDAFNSLSAVSLCRDCLCLAGRVCRSCLPGTVCTAVMASAALAALSSANVSVCCDQCGTVTADRSADDFIRRILAVLYCGYRIAVLASHRCFLPPSCFYPADTFYPFVAEYPVVSLLSVRIIFAAVTGSGLFLRWCECVVVSE